MCGIAGIWQFESRASDLDRLKAMTDSIAHRGPDGHGHWSDSSSGISLGHRRLSIIDLSERAAQPMSSQDERYVISFNGEIYNFQELRSELEQKGEEFYSDSDTEVLLRLYSIHGKDCLSLLDGMFAFSIWDGLKKELFCARDRFGEKPFFFARSAGEFVFASEIKALLSAGISEEKNTRRAYKYLLYGILEDHDHPEETFYKDIFQLRPGNYLTIDQKGNISTNEYWSLNSRELGDITIEEAIERFRTLFHTSVTRRLRSDVAVGSSLSGGLDSSSILASVTSALPSTDSYFSFSARFKDFSKDEGIHIDLMNSHCGIKGHPIFLEAQNLQDELDKILYHQDEPIGSSSILAQYMVMKKAREVGVPVLLDGQGADEFMAGYPMFLETYMHQLDPKNRAQKIQMDAIQKMHGHNPSDKNRIDFLKRRFPSLLGSVSKTGNRLRSASSDYFKGISADLVSEYIGEDNPLKSFNSLKEHELFTLRGRGLNELLRYADRNSMAHSVEVRLPFLSHELVEFTYSLSEDHIIHDGWTKYILRRSMEPLLPSSISWRKDKIGYATPEKEWLEDKVFKDRVTESAELLKSERIIDKRVEGLDWRYLSLASIYQRKS